jgi:hypothetical protein
VFCAKLLDVGVSNYVGKEGNKIRHEVADRKKDETK